MEGPTSSWGSRNRKHAKPFRNMTMMMIFRIQILECTNWFQYKFQHSVFWMEEELTWGANRDPFWDLCYFIYIYIYDILTILNNISVPILFADNTGVIIRITNITDFQSNIKTVFEYLIKWFISNILSLNFDRTNFIQFKTKNARNLCNYDWPWNRKYHQHILHQISSLNLR